MIPNEFRAVCENNVEPTNTQKPMGAGTRWAFHPGIHRPTAVLPAHLRGVTWRSADQELVNTQQLVDAKKNETTTEEHLQVGVAENGSKPRLRLAWLVG